MTYTVVLRHIPTGEEREITQKGDWSDPGAEYDWTEGNMSCDCNRAIYFYGSDDLDRACGDVEFSLPRVILSDGQILEIEEPDG